VRRLLIIAEPVAVTTARGLRIFDN
jgi:hypothetical protein